LDAAVLGWPALVGAGALPEQARVAKNVFARRRHIAMMGQNGRHPFG
jgi:hypothetical protein